MIRVCHIISGLRTGGAEMMLYHLVRRMDPERFQSSVISLLDMGSIGQRIEAAGIPVETLDLGGLRTLPGAVLKLGRVLRRHRPDVIQGWMYHGNLAATVGAMTLAGLVPHAWAIHYSLDDIRRERRALQWLIRMGAWLSGRPAATVFVSGQSAEHHQKIGYAPRKIHNIANGFDCDLFRPDAEARAALRGRWGVGDTQIVVGMFARYHSMKDHGNFLQAAAIAVERHPDLCLVLAGADVDDNNRELGTMLESVGLRGRVLLLGERSDVPALLAALDVVCLSSSHGEAFPLILGEAMACGVPGVATDVGDAAALVGDTGYIVPPRDPRALASALVALAELDADSRTALGMQARQRVLDRFSLTAVVSQYAAMYEEIAQRPLAEPASAPP